MIILWSHATYAGGGHPSIGHGDGRIVRIIWTAGPVSLN